MRILFGLLFSLLVASASAQIASPRAAGPIPNLFRVPSHVLVGAEIAKRANSVDDPSEQEKEFMYESTYYIQQRMMTGLILFNDSLSNYVTQVGQLILEHEPELKNKLAFYVYRDPSPNAFTSASGSILVTTGLLSQLDNEAQLAFILSHEIIHYKKNHMLKGYLNREKMRGGDSRNRNSRNNSWVSDYLTYSQDQEFEADRLGFELFKKTTYNVSEALRSFDVLEYSYLPFDDIQFDTTFFNLDYMKVPAGYYLNKVDPIYSDDNYEDRNSTHPNIRKRRMVLMTLVDTVSEKGRKLFVLDKTYFLNVRQKARYDLCQLYMLERDYPEAIYTAFLLLQKDPTSVYLKKIIAKALFELAAYRQRATTNNNSLSDMLFGDYSMSNRGARYSRYSRLRNNSYYRLPDYKDHPGHSQQLYHLFSKLEADEITVLALSYNWRVFKSDTSDRLHNRMCDSLFSMVVNNQNLYRSYFSTVTPDSARAKLRQDSIRRVKETGVVNDSKYAKLDRFKLDSEKERFKKFAFVVLLKDSAFTARFEYFTAKRRMESGSVERDFFPDPSTDKTKKGESDKDEDRSAQGFGITKIVVVAPDFEVYRQPARRKENKQDYAASEQGIKTLTSVMVNQAAQVGVSCRVLSPYTMDSLEVDSFNAMATLNTWFFERLFHGGNQEALCVYNQAEADTLMKQLGTRYVMWTYAEIVYEKRIRRPYLYGATYLFPPTWPVSIWYGLKKRQSMTYHSVVLDLQTGEVISLKSDTEKKGKEPENTSEYYAAVFKKLHQPKLD